MNETIGHIHCFMCGEMADVRQCKTGKKTLYWVCICGKITPNLRHGQEWLKDHMLKEPQTKAEPKAEPKNPPPPPPPETKEETKQATRSFLDIF